MALAEAQATQGEYQASIKSYADILSGDPLYRPALDQQLNAAMRWAEDFHVLTRADQNAAEIAAPALDQIFAILNAGLIRSKGSEAADVQAHIGWTHWLNQNIAVQGIRLCRRAEFPCCPGVGSTECLCHMQCWATGCCKKVEASDEAIQHFNIAVSTGKARPFVRKLQFGATHSSRQERSKIRSWSKQQTTCAKPARHWTKDTSRASLPSALVQ